MKHLKNYEKLKENDTIIYTYSNIDLLNKKQLDVYNKSKFHLHDRVKLNTKDDIWGIIHAVSIQFEPLFSNTIKPFISYLVLTDDGRNMWKVKEDLLAEYEVAANKYNL